MKQIKIVFLIIIILFCFGNLFSQNNKESSLDSLSRFDKIEFYNFVISKYISLLETDYLIKDSLIIYASVFCDEENNVNLILNVTDDYAKLLDFEYSPYYKYSKESEIYIILSRFQGYNSIERDFCYVLGAEIISESILENIFYPLSFDFCLNNNTIFNKKKYNVKTIEINRYKSNNIRVYEDGRPVDYFKYNSD